MFLSTRCPFPNPSHIRLLLANGGETDYLSRASLTDSKLRDSNVRYCLTIGNWDAAKLLIGQGAYFDDCLEESFLTGFKKRHPAQYADFFDQNGKLFKVTDPDYTDISSYVINPMQEMLYDACTMGNTYAVEEIIRDQPELAEPLAWDMSTPLHHACRFGSIEVVRLLASSGMDLTAQDILGNTPLHDASFAGEVELCKILIEEFSAVATTLNHAKRPAYVLSRTKKAQKKSLDKAKFRFNKMKVRVAGIITDAGITILR